MTTPGPRDDGPSRHPYPDWVLVLLGVGGGRGIRRHTARVLRPPQWGAEIVTVSDEREPWGSGTRYFPPGTWQVYYPIGEKFGSRGGCRIEALAAKKCIAAGDAEIPSG